MKTKLQKEFPRYTMSDIAVMEIVERAVQYGVEKLNQKSPLAIQFGCVWLDGWIAARNSLTKDDITSLRATINHYHFMDQIMEKRNIFLS